MVGLLQLQLPEITVYLSIGLVCVGKANERALVEAVSEDLRQEALLLESDCQMASSVWSWCTWVVTQGIGVTSYKR